MEERVSNKQVSRFPESKFYETDRERKKVKVRRCALSYLENRLYFQSRRSVKVLRKAINTFVHFYHKYKTKVIKLSRTKASQFSPFMRRKTKQHFQRNKKENLRKVEIKFDASLIWLSNFFLLSKDRHQRIVKQARGGYLFFDLKNQNKKIVRKDKGCRKKIYTNEHFSMADPTEA